MERDITELRAHIERCHSLAAGIGDSETKANLIALALKYEERLQDLEDGAPIGPAD